MTEEEHGHIGSDGKRKHGNDTETLLIMRKNNLPRRVFSESMVG